MARLTRLLHLKRFWSFLASCAKQARYVWFCFELVTTTKGCVSFFMWKHSLASFRKCSHFNSSRVFIIPAFALDNNQKYILYFFTNIDGNMTIIRRIIAFYFVCNVSFSPENICFPF